MNIPRTLYAFLIVLCFTGTGSGEANAQVGNSVQAYYDSSSVAELFNRIPVGLTFSGKTPGATKGWLHGRIGWNELSVTSPQGTVDHGVLTFDRGKVWNNHHRISFKVVFRGETLQTDLLLPYVQSLRFHLFTDSLKRDNPFDLNVEGRFSTGKIYPLDTGMVAFTKMGGGRLNGNLLTVTGDDSATQRIKVVARLKTDPAISDSIIIPVKIVPDTASLPSEAQLLKKWKRRGSRH